MKKFSKHGMSYTKIYGVYRGMIKRCKSNHPTFKSYKKKGIQVCDHWISDFMAFHDWAISNGYRDGLQIDRINNHGDYTPDNCRFVTPLVNTNNRDITVMVLYKGELASYSNIIHAKNLTACYHAIRMRIKRGWSIERAIDTPVKTLTHGL